jgi:hypothetical protein
MSTTLPTKSLELYLENWREHCETGCHVTFLVTPEDLDYFRAATLKKGKLAGQRYMCVLVELGADETPVPAAVAAKPEVPKSAEMKAAELRALDAAQFTKGADGTYSRNLLATPEPLTPEQMLENFEHGKKHSKFPIGLTGLAVRWCTDPHFQGWLEDMFSDRWNANPSAPDEERAKGVICQLCGIDSRKELDENGAAGSVFKDLILGPYADARLADGMDTKE